MRWLLVLLVTVHAIPAWSAPAADPRATFRARNAQRFTLIESDRAGRIHHVRTSDPSLASADEFTLRGWLQQNADLFGGTVEDNAARSAAGRLAYYLVDPASDQILGAAIVHRARGVVDVRIVHARRSPDAEVRALVGTRHVQILHYGNAIRRDCKMGGRSCQPRTTATRRRSVVLTADDVSAALQLRVIGGALRLVVCVSAEAPIPDEEPDSTRVLIRASLAGLPRAIDATTGARRSVASCAAEL